MQCLESSPQTQMSQTKRSPFKYVITIEPLGLLYGSAGRFLSPENLVGRSGQSFPPSAATLSGLFAAHANTIEFDEDEKKDKEERKEYLKPLQLAGPFWAKRRNPQNFYVPTPLNCLVKDGKIQHVMAWHPKPEPKPHEETPHEAKDDNSLKGWWKVWTTDDHGNLGWNTPPNDKFESNTWLAIRHWKRLQKGQTPPVASNPWKFVPHLHPRLKEDERRVVEPKKGAEGEENDRGSLFLENGVQLAPDSCLVYLSNTPIDNGCYRFGGEGHLVDVRCKEMGSVLQTLLSDSLKRSFATITPAVWGSNRRSYRAPESDKDGNLGWPGNPLEALLTQRPTPYRYRLGDSNDPRPGAPKRLSRGRYAVPPGTVYVLKDELKLSEKSEDKEDKPKEQNCWQNWPDKWFPEEGISYKRFGCGLSLPMESAIAHSE